MPRQATRRVRARPLPRLSRAGIRKAADLRRRRRPPAVPGNCSARPSTRMRWICLAYCLMGNHVHLLSRPAQPNLGTGMHRLHGGVRAVRSTAATASSATSSRTGSKPSDRERSRSSGWPRRTSRATRSTAGLCAIAPSDGPGAATPRLVAGPRPCMARQRAPGLELLRRRAAATGSRRYARSRRRLSQRLPKGDSPL